MKKRSMYLLLIMIFLVAALAGCSSEPAKPAETKQAETQAPKPARPEVILSTTTSTRDSGLLDVLVPAFEKKTGYVIKTIAVGTGQALAMGEKGEADVLLTHAPDAEIKVEEKGAVINRRLLMHNDYIIIGAAEDSAKIKGKSTQEALTAISSAQAAFVSRGDNSGTHMLEKKLWEQVNIKPAAPWYIESGTGMGQTLTIANEKKGYTISDRATYLAQKKNINLEILVEGDKNLLNIYHVMEVNPAKFDKVNKDGAKAFADFLLSDEGKKIISEFGKDKFGQPLFFLGDGTK
ncbi:MAG: substrate-binding domain-containing protein [Sporomusaceae bacterium]|nr:substrate-binding domain-containing protein [Sporomusaceae bacterium]